MTLLKILLFNPLARYILKIRLDGLSTPTTIRIQVFLVEGLYLLVVFLPFILVVDYVAQSIQQSLQDTLSASEVQAVSLLNIIPVYFLCMVACNKDYYGGQSIVKRVWGYQLVDSETGKTAGPYQCMLRNSTIPVLPLELPFVILNRERRIGDYIAGTKLIKVEPSDPEVILGEFKKSEIGPETMRAVGLPTLVFFVWNVISWWKSYAIL